MCVCVVNLKLKVVLYETVYGFCINIVKLKRSYFFLLKGNTVIEMILCYRSVDLKKSEPEPSCVSMKSDHSMDRPIYFKSDDTRYYIFFCKNI